MNCNGVKPRPTYEGLCVPILLITLSSYFARYAPFARDSKLLTQLGGIGMKYLEELARRDIIERHKENMIRQIAVDTGAHAQLLRAFNKITF